jgi:hypothetical protein
MLLAIVEDGQEPSRHALATVDQNTDLASVINREDMPSRTTANAIALKLSYACDANLGSAHCD